ncbi:enoyl-CoA hydratase/isomerase family protein [Pseudomonadota bacterium AL_CKDN230030165-1A_HGKHYDSX7]
MTERNDPVQPGEVRLERRDAVAWVTLSLPGRLNAISIAMWRQLAERFTALAQDGSVRCIVLQGDGGNFAAGADIREFPEARGDFASVVHYHRDILAPALHAVAACPHPVIASIAGVCVGGGLELASQCDLRIASADARFGVPINRLGFPLAPDEMRGMLDLIGRAATVALLLEGRVFDAAEALRLGLLTRVVEPADLEAQTQAAVSRVLAGAPAAARLNKRYARRLTDPAPLTDAEYNDFFQYAESRDHHEGVRAFLAGTTPTFTGD